MPLAQIEWSKAYATWGLSTASLSNAYSPSRLLDVLGAELPKGQDARVLELGCAPGRWLAWAGAALGISPVGIELDPEGARLSRSLYPELPVVRGDAFRLPFPDADFDAVFSIGLLEHFEDPGPIIAEARRVLKNGGISIWIIPNLIPGSICRWHWSTFRAENYAAHKTFTLDDLEAMVGREGFRVTRREYNGLYIPHSQRVLRLLPGQRAFWRFEGPRSAANLVVVATAESGA